MCQASDKPLKSCGQCHLVHYCSVECQRKDWKTHKKNCKDTDTWLQEQADKKLLKYDDFEEIKKLGDGNFTQIFQVFHKKFPNKFYALKICKVEKVQSMQRETDVIMEKHALNKLKELYSTDMPTVKLIGTFKDEMHLYFLTEMFKSKCEVWEHVRSFGMLSPIRAKYTFY